MAISLRKLWQSKRGRVSLVAAIALGIITTLRASDPNTIEVLRERTFDSYQRLAPRPYSDFPVRIVAIDEASLAAFGQWPWPRTRLAALVTRLSDLGAAVVAFDAIFPEPDRTSPRRIADELDWGNAADAARVSEFMSQFPDHDQVFADAMAKAPVVLGFAITPKANASRPSAKAGFAIAGASPIEVLPHFAGAAANIEPLDKAAAGIGSMNISARDRSGIVRRLPMLFTDGQKIYPSLAVEALRVAQQAKSLIVRGTGASRELDTGSPALVDMRIGQFAVPLTDDGEIWMHYDRDRPERYVSAKDVLDPAKEAQVRPRIDGSIIFVGVTAAGFLDIWLTPLRDFVPGVSIHAQAVEQILGQNFLERPDWADGAEIVTMVVLGALLTYLLLVAGARYATIIGTGSLILAFSVSWFAYRQFGLLIDPVYPSLGGFAVYLAVVGLLYLATDKEKKFVRQAFGQYLAPELLGRLEQAPDMMRLGGEIRPLTLMFLDVRDFTPISERLGAADLVEFINHLLSPLSDAIQAELGTIDKYIGDSIMAFWNAPLDIADHPQRACRAALKMRAILDDLNARDAFSFHARGFNELKVRIGIGINSGEACVGNMGSERRFNYSAMGDAVNITARIESSTKTLGVDILLSDDTARMVPGFAFLEVGELMMKGKSHAVKLHVLVGDESVAATSEFQELARLHGGLRAAIAAGHADEAADLLVHCRSLGGNLLASFYDHFEKASDELASDAARRVPIEAEAVTD